MPLWLVVVFAILAFVVRVPDLGRGRTRRSPCVGLLAGSLSLAVPLIFGALGGVIGERAGVVNIAIEGQLLAGAFTRRGRRLGHGPAARSGSSPRWSPACSSAFGARGVRDQVLRRPGHRRRRAERARHRASRASSTRRCSQPNAAAAEHAAAVRAGCPIPLLSEIPIIGPVLFRQTIIVYLMYVAVAARVLRHCSTPGGASGCAPWASTRRPPTPSGIKVNRTRFWNVALAGAIAGLGGTFFTIGSGIAFNKEMTAGAGFIALAAVIFGQWDPIKATLAALLFGFASNLQNTLSAHRVAGAQRVHADAAVPRDDLRRRRPRRQGRARPPPTANRTSSPERDARPRGIRRTDRPSNAETHHDRNGSIDWDELRERAREAMAKAYVPYSEFPVGAAAPRRRRPGRERLQRRERVVRRHALRRVLARVGARHVGRRQARRLRLRRRRTARTLMPCGRCRQLLYEHSAAGMLLETVSGISTIDEVLPDAFGPRAARRIRGRRR